MEEHPIPLPDVTTNGRDGYTLENNRDFTVVVSFLGRTYEAAPVSMDTRRAPRLFAFDVRNGSDWDTLMTPFDPDAPHASMDAARDDLLAYVKTGEIAEYRAALARVERFRADVFAAGLSLADLGL